ncbi:MAG: hypothetical protein ACRETY_02845 [Steroidobacteraceae bacterium]
MRLVSRPASIIASLSVALAACANDDAPAGPADTAGPATAAAVTACDLVTRDEGAAALGEAVNEQVISPGSAEAAAMSMCTVQATDSPGKTLSLSLRVSPVEDSQPDSVRQTLTDSGVTSEDVPGIGDDAFWGASELHVFFDGNSYLSISIRGLDDGPEALANASDIAQRAMQRVAR